VTGYGLPDSSQRCGMCVTCRAYSAVTGPSRSSSRYCQCYPAAVLAAVVPGGPLGGHPVSLENPVAKLEPGGQDLPEEAFADEPPELDHAGQEELVLDHPVDHPGLAGLVRQPQGTLGRVGQRLLRVDVLARGDGLGQAGLTGAGDLRVEVHPDSRVGQHLVQAGGPALQAVPFGDLPQPLLAAPDQDRFRAERRPVLEGDTALVAEAEDGTHQMLAVAHPAGDPVHGHLDHLARHRLLPGGSGPAAHALDGPCTMLWTGLRHMLWTGLRHDALERPFPD
jgi:hypothetical protein